jgi:hypothetical protein
MTDEKLCCYALPELRNRKGELIVVSCFIDRDSHPYERCRRENMDSCDVYMHRENYKIERIL